MIVDISELVGKVVTEIKEHKKDSIEFICSDGTRYLMTHLQDCCESVCIEDVIGDLKDLISQEGLRAKPITVAEEVSSEDFEEQWLKEKLAENEGFGTWESYTWTFYKLATLNGYVTIRWFGESNGYYSERVDIIKMNEDDNYEMYNYERY